MYLCTSGIDTVKIDTVRKRIVCGRSVSWWDNKLRGMVRERRACHKRVLEGSADVWNEYCEKCRVLKSKI